MTRVTLRDAGNYVHLRRVFKGNSIYGCWVGADDHRRYVVYSYGTHFPMYLYDADTGKWYGNNDKYSRTTSRHQGACRPPRVDFWMPTETMQRFAAMGVIPYINSKLRGEAA